MSLAYDDLTDDQRRRRNPALLRPGTLVFLWPPDEIPWAGSRPITARVERATADTLCALDLRDNARAQYDVGRDVSNPDKPVWSWDVCAPPQTPTCLGSGVEIIDAPLDKAERTRLLLGEPGEHLKISLASGEMVHGTLTRLIMGAADQWEAEWGEVQDMVPGRGGELTIHMVRIAEVAKVTRVRRA